MKDLRVDGVPEKDLDLCLEKIDEFLGWAREKNIDRWALRASLVKALHEDSESFFEETKGTFRELAAFDNGVANALESSGGG